MATFAHSLPHCNHGEHGLDMSVAAGLAPFDAEGLARFGVEGLAPWVWRIIP